MRLFFIIHSHIKLLYDNIDTILTFMQEYLIRQMAQYKFSPSYIVVDMKYYQAVVIKT